MIWYRKDTLVLDEMSLIKEAVKTEEWICEKIEVGK